MIDRNSPGWTRWFGPLNQVKSQLCGAFSPLISIDAPRSPQTILSQMHPRHPGHHVDGGAIGVFIGRYYFKPKQVAIEMQRLVQVTYHDRDVVNRYRFHGSCLPWHQISPWSTHTCVPAVHDV